MLLMMICKRQGERLHRGKSSRSREEFSVALFIIGNPSIDGFLRYVSNRRQVLILSAKTGQQESHKLLLLLDRQNIGGLLDFKKRTLNKT
jgi:hypothetical protein